MTYATKDGVLTERIWNSRDGVTPFGISSPCGKHEMLHVNWQEDAFRPFHRPAIGERVFIDMTLERRRYHAARVVEHWWDNESSPARERYASKEEMAERLMSDFDPALREPDMLTLADPWHVVAVCATASEEYIRMVGHPRRFA